MGPTISVVIPNFNGLSMLLSCLDSLFVERYVKSEIIVVDNGSRDGSVEVVRGKFPGVQVVSLTRNLGFSGAVNVGIARALGEYIFLLNNDTLVSPGCVFRIAAYISASSQKNIGSYQIPMLDFKRKERVDALGVELDESYTACQVGRGKLFEGYSSQKKLWGVSAGAGVYKKRMLDDIKVAGEYFDEDFFAFYEDVDLGARARLRGWECGLIKNTFVYHLGSGTPVASYRKIYWLTRNRLLAIFKNTPLEVLKKWVISGKVVNLSLVKHFIKNREYVSLLATLAGHLGVLSCLAKMAGKRRAIISGRRIPRREILAWLSVK